MSDNGAMEIEFEGDASEDSDEDLGILSVLRAVARDAPRGGVLGAMDAARGRRSSRPATPAEPVVQTRDELADLIAAEIAAGAKVAELAEKYRPRFVAFGLVRDDSQPKTVLRRFQEFVRKYVDDKRIAVEELPERMRRGRETGGHKRLETPFLDQRAQTDGTPTSERDTVQ